MPTDQRLEIPLHRTSFDRAAEAGEAIRWEEPNNRFITNVHAASLTVHLPVGGGGLRAMILICPGGGYGGVSIDKEGHFVASWLNGHGIAAAVLKYRYPEPVDDLPLPFQDGIAALACIGDHADEWGVDLTKIGLMGFSAGGHLAGSLGLRFRELAGDRALPRPAFLCLIYPVVTAASDCGHLGSFKNLLQGELTPERVQAHSLENHLLRDSPPMFLFHAADDATVPVAHSQLLDDASQVAGSHSTLRICPEGGHGFGMGKVGEPCAKWPQAFLEWLDQPESMPDWLREGCT
jgi:acetyl esterase/lipase